MQIPTSQDVAAALAAVRAKAPLVYNITNNVVTNTTANALIAVGASPAMSHAVEEVEELTTFAGCLVVNIGTPGPVEREAMLEGVKAAAKTKTPVALDPVAGGVTALRRELCASLLEHPVTTIRGNASEIMALAGESGSAKGVDAGDEAAAALGAATRLARQKRCVVVVSGATDYITDGERVLTVTGGSPLMARVTGMGCTATAVVGAFLAAYEDPLLASVAAMGVMAVAGELAAARSQGPGSFWVNFLDSLYNLDDAALAARLTIAEAV